MSDSTEQFRVYGMPDEGKRTPPPPEGQRGERAAEPEDDAFRHAVSLEDGGTIAVVEASGVAFAESTGRVPVASGDAGLPDIVETAPAPAPAAPPRGPTRSLLPWMVLGVIAGLVLARRRAAPAVMAAPVPVALVEPAGEAESFVQTRDAGPELIRDEDGANWDAVDEGVDESFPASDPPAYSIPGR